MTLEDSENWLLIPTPTPYYIDTDTVRLVQSKVSLIVIGYYLYSNTALAEKQCEHFTQEVSLRFPQAIYQTQLHIQHVH